MVGREVERQKLQRVLDRNRAQIIVVYGRRRVGKTYLINEFFNNTFAFKHTAVSPVDKGSAKGQLQNQLEEFFYSMKS